MTRNDLASRPSRWFGWASGVLLIAAGCMQPLVTAAAAPQIPAGEARIWLYQGYEPPSGGANYSPTLIPTIIVNGTAVGTVPSGRVFYRDVLPGHYDIAIPNLADIHYPSAHFDLLPGQQAFIKIVVTRGNGITPRQHWSVFAPFLVSQQLAETEVLSLTADGQR